MMALGFYRAELQVADATFLTSTDDYTSAVSWPPAAANCPGSGEVFGLDWGEAEMCV